MSGGKVWKLAFPNMRWEALKAQGIGFSDFLHDQIALAVKRTQR